MIASVDPLVLIALIAMAGFVVKTVTGLGFALVFMPLASLVLDPKPLVPVSLVYGLIANFLVLVETRRHVAGRILPLMMVAGIAGVPLGTLVLGAMSAAALKTAIGLIVVVLAGALLLGQSAAFPHRFVGAAAAGFTSGVIHTATGMGGPPLALFLANQGYQKQAFRAAITAIFMPLSVASLLGLAGAGLVNWDTLRTSLFLVPALGIGYLIGLWLVRFVSPGRFQQLTVLIVALTGVVNVIDGGAALLRA